MTGAERIALERNRQITEAGFTRGHDAEVHDDGSLLAAALIVAGESLEGFKSHTEGPSWAFDIIEKHKDDPIQQLVIAGALIAAEIDRRQED